MKHFLIVMCIVTVGVVLTLIARADTAPQGTPPITYKLPAGTYTALVFTATGAYNSNHGTAQIMNGRNEYFVNVAAGGPITIPFVPGWRVNEGQVKIKLTNGEPQPGGILGAIPNAWAISTEGPVELER